MNSIKSIIKENYNIDIIDMLPQQGGWASLAYRVFTQHDSYFLKVYEKKRASTSKLTALIDQYVPIMVWLMNNSNLKGKISVPFMTSADEYKCEDLDGVYLLYNYIEGETIGNQDLTKAQVYQFSKMIAELHLYGEDIPLETSEIKEDFDVPFIQFLSQVIQNENKLLPADIQELIAPYKSPLIRQIQTVNELSQNLRNVELKMVLCHTDLHYWNLMQSGQQLHLIDWEGLKLAPVEADLMFLVDKPYYSEFLSIYQKTHQNFTINPDVMTFYKGKRQLEDIWEFLEQLLYDEQEEQEKIITINYLFKELNEIGN